MPLETAPVQAETTPVQETEEYKAASQKKKRRLEKIAEFEKARRIYEAFNLPNSEGSYYLEKFKADKSAFKSVELLPAFEEGLSALQKEIASAKDPAELALNLVFGMMMGMIKSTNNALTQMNKNMKENRKIELAQRKAFMEHNLKSNNNSMLNLSKQLVQYTQHNLLNDSRYGALPVSGGKNRLEKALIAKRDFAVSLPKTQDGNIDFARMTRAQKRRYASYMAALSYEPRWYHHVMTQCGMRITQKQYKEITDTALKLRNIKMKTKAGHAL